jgi:hypothetical protein
LGEEHRLRVLEKSVLRIFGPKSEEDGSWRKLHDDELHNLYYKPNIIRVIKLRRMRWAGHVARMGRGEVFTGEGKSPLGRPRCRWERNAKMNLSEVGIDGANWIRLAHDNAQRRALVNTVLNLRVP